jgi:AraC-like DNA-binding protein
MLTARRLPRSWTRSALATAFTRYVLACLRGETPPRVGELADELGLSRSQLTELSRDLLGCPPGVYLRAIRREKATRLLRDPGLTTTAIAYRAGYGTRRSLFRSFRRETGRTPRQSAMPQRERRRTAAVNASAASADER